MDKKAIATKRAIEITKIVLAATPLPGTPNALVADDIADFIETLAKRLETLGEEETDFTAQY